MALWHELVNIWHSKLVNTQSTYWRCHKCRQLTNEDLYFYNISPFLPSKSHLNAYQAASQPGGFPSRMDEAWTGERNNQQKTRGRGAGETSAPTGMQNGAPWQESSCCRRNIHVLDPSHVWKGKLQEQAKGNGTEMHPDSKSSHALARAGKKTCPLARIFIAGCDRA